MTFPVSAGEVTRDWLTQVLHDGRHLDAADAVANFTLTPIGAGFGQTGDAARITFTYSGPGNRAPASAFIKFATSDARRRAASQRLGLYQREVDFYTRLAPHTAVRAPLAYFAGISPQGDFATLLLEDFPDHRAGDDVVGLSPGEAGAVVDLLADLHAPFWGKVGTLGVPPLEMGSRAVFAPAWDVMARDFAEHLPDAFRAARDRFLDAIDGLQAWVTGEPATLGHGDLKLDNILFGTGDDAGIVAVDWQAVRPQRGIRDFGYAISHSMNVADRRASEHDLLRRYVAALQRRGVDYSEDDAERDYPIAMLFDFLTVIYIIGVNINTHERAILRKRKLLERTTTALQDWDALPLLDRFAR